MEARGRGGRKRPVSIVRDQGQYESVCGYCGEESTTRNRGMLADKLSHVHYQLLLDRMWRRCGKLLYRTDVEGYRWCCCPPYSIRVDANKFKISKRQKKALRRFRSYLNGEWEPRAGSGLQAAGDVDMTEAKQGQEGAAGKKGKGWGDCCQDCTKVQAACQGIWQECVLPAIQGYAAERGLGCDAESISQLAKTTRRANRKIEMGYAKDKGKHLKVFCSSVSFRLARDWGKALKSANEIAEGLGTFLTGNRIGFETLEKGGLGIRITGVEAKSGFLNFVANLADEDSLSCSCERNGGKKKKATQHNAVEEGPPKRTLTMEMMPSTFLQEEYELFCRYQQSVHKDKENDVESYKGFLVETPIEYESVQGCSSSSRQSNRDSPPSVHMPCEIPAFQGYGAFHQQYRIDGKLVAVGVVDVMANCLSSKYFFWDPDYAFLELGKISSLAEIDFVKLAHREQRGLHYYYQGFYIHTCPKMAYKADYKPAELLCPTSLTWVNFDEGLRQKMKQSQGRMLVLAESGFQGLYQDEEKRCAQLVEEFTRLGDLKCMLHDKFVLFRSLLEWAKGDYKEMLKIQAGKWMASCGSEASSGMIYKLA
ncbi:Arginyl-tRNA--protein transferase [Chloropicon primus]|uniref:Arginyl-tRNA--protein transferase n=1 Tax=Chloropicon primus TaxID=1764295 RepID=A0A5B8MKI1_9CHLO|nr:Arginyl-tRNA--protein transferase [Chloropicon primus]UPQ99983.1 Arginyl-tRNA--protein transferase [Chloropicon primus]|eukprot:QDZ20771.1 Arginyl-tRNA--protein transferase [Chloropicon primus]